VNEPLTDLQFDWFCSALTFVVAASWIVVDIVRMRRALRDRASGGSTPEIRDRVFGSVIGLIVGAIGVTGVLLFHLG
jgi:uncharacterized protein YacL